MALTVTADEVAGLVRLLGFDPWSLTLAERRLLRHVHDREQAAWLPRLGRLVEPPAPGQGFPAFLLATQPFADLRDGIGKAKSMLELDTATADRLQRFVDRYRDWLAG
jgi:hypothetical protein